jgi:uncharacterized protein (TIGR04255 family)
MKLKNPPIVEAVLEIDCDIPPSVKISELENKARDAFRSHYSQFRKVYMQEHSLHAQAVPGAEPRANVASAQRLEAFQFLHADGKQLVQIREQGFAFNRLAPYSSLNDYLPEIERTWKVFQTLVSPIQVKAIKLRAINRILLPAPGGKVAELQLYLKICPRLPDEIRLQFNGFLNQHFAVEPSTGNQASIILASQPFANEQLPIILDITSAVATTSEPSDWQAILDKIQSLRGLNNSIFENSLTPECLKLYQQ